MCDWSIGPLRPNRRRHYGFRFRAALDVAAQRCSATGFSRPSSARRHRLWRCAVRCGRRGILSRCIGNNHPTIGGRRKPAEADPIARIGSRIVRRMVVLFRAIKARKAGLFSRAQGPREKVRRLDGGQTDIRTRGGCLMVASPRAGDCGWWVRNFCLTAK